ncbi:MULTISPECIES: transposase [Enterococcus]|uniref:transposase n=1 Tax=Enterococcus TaxID=1350 RepID=UPI001162E061|nr:transposase [Enterococcus avium]HAP3020792.1 hypothetical protein [Enterococcus faecalis]AYQ24039.1 hypothetical protein AUF16_04945 [Enterococcus avium]HBI1561128.1 transposase [Enterococcus faecalis]HBI1564401.1 transposase [Enterococcus faecalis]HBI1716967.1 transposase [Enterococcus faecalis]
MHQIRNNIRFVDHKDLKVITTDLKSVYKSSTEELALEAPSEFDENEAKKEPIVTKSWMSNWTE